MENMIKYIEKIRKEYELGNDCRFLIGYVAGPTGYGLAGAPEERLWLRDHGPYDNKGVKLRQEEEDRQA